LVTLSVTVVVTLAAVIGPADMLLFVQETTQISGTEAETRMVTPRQTDWRTIMWYTMIRQLKRYALPAKMAGALAVLVLVLALMASERARLTHADEPQPEPTPTTNDYQPNPFPIPTAITDTVQLVLDQYLGRQPIAPPPSGDQDVTPLTASANVYLPLTRNTSEVDEPAPTPRPRPTHRADIAVTVWPEPSIHVMRGGRLTYELRVNNYDRGDARGVRVRLPYDRRQMRPIASRLDRDKGDWVSRVTDREVEVTFGPVDGKAGRTGLLVFEVAAALSNGTILDMRPSYTWWDGTSEEGPYRANWPPVIVGEGPASAPWVATGVTPTVGEAGTIHTFESNRFAPGEGIITWLNTPSGVRALDLRGLADSQGAVSLTFSSAGLSPGNYQLVLYGGRSQLTGVASFTVR
jgi:hypothetical protein